MATNTSGTTDGGVIYSIGRIRVHCELDTGTFIAKVGVAYFIAGKHKRQILKIEASTVDLLATAIDAAIAAL